MGPFPAARATNANAGLVIARCVGVLVGISVFGRGWRRTDVIRSVPVADEPTKLRHLLFASRSKFGDNRWIENTGFFARIKDHEATGEEMLEEKHRSRIAGQQIRTQKVLYNTEYNC